VIKVERPARPGAPGATTPAAGGRRSCATAPAPRPADAAYYLGTNRKQALDQIDIATAQVRRSFAPRDSADVFVENFKVGDMARHGLDAPALLARNHASSTARSPASARPARTCERAGYDYAIQGMGGLMSVTGPSRAEIADDASGAARRRSASRSPTSSPACMRRRRSSPRCATAT